MDVTARLDACDRSELLDVLKVLVSNSGDAAHEVAEILDDHDRKRARSRDLASWTLPPGGAMTLSPADRTALVATATIEELLACASIALESLSENKPPYMLWRCRQAGSKPLGVIVELLDVVLSHSRSLPGELQRAEHFFWMDVINEIGAMHEAREADQEADWDACMAMLRGVLAKTGLPQQFLSDIREEMEAWA